MRPTHRRHALSLLLALLLLLAGCADQAPEATPAAQRTARPSAERTARPSAKPGQPTERAEAPTRAPTRPAVSRDDQTWLVLIYSDADDEVLEEDMYNDLNEAELVGSSERVTIVAQMDRFEGGFDGGGDWTSAKRFLVEQDDDLEQLNSSELEDLGEVNMADGDTLVEFVSWAVERYPADRHVLILSDHGAGWPGGWNDPDPETSGDHDIALAESFGDMLFLMELDQALGTIRDSLGIEQFELIGFDACLMSHIEVMSAMAPHARYSVASQEIEPSLGWAYAAFLGRLVDSPEIDGAELARAIVDSYIEQDQQIVDDDARARYVENTYEYEGEMSAEEVAEEELKSITLTAVDLGAIPGVIEALDELARALEQADQKQVALARRYAQAFDSVFGEDEPRPYIDIGSFASLVKERLDDPTVSQAVGELEAALDQAVISEKHGEEKAGATGLSIHFPNSKLYRSDDAGIDSYTTVASRFAEQSLWDNYLSFHYTKEPLPERRPEPTPTLENQPTETPEDEPSETPEDEPTEEEIEAPGAEELTIAELTLSSDVASEGNPVTLQTEIGGENIAFVYIFVGYLDEQENAIQIVDMDFIDAEQTREVEGVFYPDWGEESPLEIEFEWEPVLYALSDGESEEIALFDPQDYGAPDEGSTYTLEGMYTSAKSKRSRYATMLFQDGELVQVLAATGQDDTGALRELTPKPGDSFTIYEQWIPLEEDAEEDIVSYEGATLVFGEENMLWNEMTAPAGDYLLGIIAEDFDGNLYEAYEVVTVE